MSESSTRELKKIILNFVLIWSFLLIAIEIFSLFSLWTINKVVINENNKLQNLLLTNESLWSADASFKSQIQAWKNILIRGSDVDDYKKYKINFNIKYLSTQKNLNNAYDNCLSIEKVIDCEKIITVKNLHEEINDRYLTALNSVSLKDPNGSKKLDKMVRGIDRELQNIFFELNQKVRLIYENKQQNLIHEVDLKYKQIRYFLLITLGIALLTILVRLYKILKTDFKDE
jgi:hypothetical protein